MENTSTESIIKITASQKEFFKSGATLNVEFRKQMLKKLLDALEKWEERLSEALWTDLHKSYEEAFLTEISIVFQYIVGRKQGSDRFLRIIIGLHKFLQVDSHRKTPFRIFAYYTMKEK